MGLLKHHRVFQCFKNTRQMAWFKLNFTDRSICKLNMQSQEESGSDSNF